MSSLVVTSRPTPARATSLRTLLLLCGALSSVLYLAMNVITPMLFEGYDWVDQTVSELSAIGAPTRALWVPLAVLYDGLIVVFGVGIWTSFRRERRLRVAAALLVAHGLVGAAWPPMHLRPTLAAGGGTMSDTLHIVWTTIAVPLMLLAIAFASGAFARRFRVYSVATIVVTVIFGALTGMQGPRLSTNEPTPWIGVWERVSIATFMTWVVVLSVLLLRKDAAGDPSTSSSVRSSRESN